MKIKTILAVFSLTVTMLLSAACTAVNAEEGGNPRQVAKEIAVRNSDEFDQNKSVQKQVEINQGDTLLVTLVSNATTGFSWDETATIADTGILQQLTHKSVVADSGGLGAAGAEQWTFKALKAGTTTVHLEYSRQWAGGEKGLRVFDVTVMVK